MEMILFCGPQASGKTSFYNRHFADTHLRINLDMLRTRRREAAILEACLRVGQRFLVDNTNPTAEERAWYLARARESHFGAVAYFFDVPLEVCLERNAHRTGKAKIPDRGVRATFRKLKPPTPDEGFAEVRCVDEDGAVTSVAASTG